MDRTGQERTVKDTHTQDTHTHTHTHTHRTVNNII